jgi:L-2-hydroxyglutarate oxidase LhgO
LLSPETGIVDGQGYMLALQAEAETRGATIALRTQFRRARRTEEYFEAELTNEHGEPFFMRCRNIVNAAGHGAHAVANAIEGMRSEFIPPRFLAKGSYCSVSGPSPFRHLIYPVPVPGALGIHATLDLFGQLRLGPNIEWVTELEYSLRDDLPGEFAAACRDFWPEIVERKIVPSYCGIRPKINGPGSGQQDFRIDGPQIHGLAGLINLFGIESPGLTASLAIGQYILQSHLQG